MYSAESLNSAHTIIKKKKEPFTRGEGGQTKKTPKKASFHENTPKTPQNASQNDQILDKNAHKHR